jgi:hypothetical protein
VLSVVPIIKVESVATFALKITSMIVAMNLLGIAILWSARRRIAAAGGGRPFVARGGTTGASTPR